MKKVLEVAYPALNNSGVPAVIMGIVRELHNEFIFDALVFKSDVGFFKDEFLSYGGKIHTINCDKNNNKIMNFFEKLSRPWRIYRNTKKILSENQYDVIHCHNGWDAGWCLMAAKKIGVKIKIVHSHTSNSLFEHDSSMVKIYHKLMKKIILNSDCIKIGCSKKALERLYGKNNEGIVILNGVDINKFSKDKVSNKKISKNKPKFIFIGRFCVEKNPIFVIEVFREILKREPEATLKMIGYGYMEDSVKEKIKLYNIENKVELLPPFSDIPKLLCDSDFLIFPSLREGLGIVLIEAQFMGVQCFSSNTVPLESDLGLCKYYSLEDSASIWADKILKHIKNTNEEKNFPKKEYMDKYNLKNIAQKYKKIYESGEVR